MARGERRWPMTVQDAWHESLALWEAAPDDQAGWELARTRVIPEQDAEQQREALERLVYAVEHNHGGLLLDALRGARAALEEKGKLDG